MAIRIKAIRDLAHLPGKEMFAQISIGYEHILNNATRLDKDAQLLREQGRPSGCRILSGLAEEEAAKCLILMDAVRCPRNPPATLSRHLQGFNDHLAKGLYAEACSWAPTDFKEFESYVQRERQEYHLDGPSDIDWIFPNRIRSGREDAMYVDYVAADENKHYWQTPHADEYLLPRTPPSLSLARRFSDAGCITPDALLAIAEFWRPIPMTPDLPWVELCELNWQTLKMLDEAGHIREQPQPVYGYIADKWPFPMFSINLRLERGNEAELEEIQRNWAPDI